MKQLILNDLLQLTIDYETQTEAILSKFPGYFRFDKAFYPTIGVPKNQPQISQCVLQTWIEYLEYRHVKFSKHQLLIQSGRGVWGSMFGCYNLINGNQISINHSETRVLIETSQY